MKQEKCNQCGFEWFSRVEEPLTCPRCKRHDWKEENKKSKKDISVSFDSLKDKTIKEVIEISKQCGGNENGRQ